MEEAFSVEVNREVSGAEGECVGLVTPFPFSCKIWGGGGFLLFLQESYTDNTASDTTITVTAIRTTKQPAVGWDQQTDISFFQQSEIINNGNKS